MNRIRDETIQRAIHAFQNVPEVGAIYDQQHADTHMHALIELRELIGLGPAPGAVTGGRNRSNGRRRDYPRGLLTAGQQREYLACRGSRCVWCGSQDIQGTGRSNSDADWHENELRCNACGALWLDIYTISGVQAVSGPFPTGNRPFRTGQGGQARK